MSGETVGGRAVLRQTTIRKSIWVSCLLASGAAAVLGLLVLPARQSAALAESAPASPDPVKLEQRLTTDIRPLLQQHCFDCHGNGKHKGKVSLDQLNLPALRADRKTLQKMADVLHERAMPPEDQTQPSQAQVDTIAGWVHDALEYVDASNPRDPGHVTIHRLNRVEYNNTIRDLVGVDFQPAADFPADDTGYGFDNIADVLTMSPLLAEKYLAAAEQVMEKAIV